MIQKINRNNWSRPINIVDARIGNHSSEKTGVTAALMAEGMKKFGLNAKMLDQQRSNVAAQMVANTALFAKKYGVNAGLVNSVGTGTEGLADHVARTITLLGPIIQYNTTGFDHVVVYPMKTRNCTFIYPELYYGTNKGSYEQGDLIRSPFQTTPQTSTYPSKHIGDPTKPLGVAANPETYVIAKDTDETSFVLLTPNAIQNTIRIAVGADIAYFDGTAWVNPASFTVTQNEEVIAVTLADEATADTPVFVSYNYDNEKLPRGMVPTLNARIGHIPISAEFYQIQIICDAYADFEARNDYGFKLVDALIEQAPLEVSYAISRQIYNGLYQMAKDNTTATELELTIRDFRVPGQTFLFKDIVAQNLGTLISSVDSVLRRRTGRYSLTNLTFGAEATRILNAMFVDDRSDGEKSGAYKLGEFSKTGIYIDEELPVTKLLQTAGGVISEVSLDTPTPAGSICIGFKVAYFGDCKRGNLAAGVWGEYMSIVPTDELFVPSFEKWKGFATAGVFAPLNGMLTVAGAIIIPA